MGIGSGPRQVGLNWKKKTKKKTLKGVGGGGGWLRVSVDYFVL